MPDDRVRQGPVGPDTAVPLAGIALRSRVREGLQDVVQVQGRDQGEAGPGPGFVTNHQGRRGETLVVQVRAGKHVVGHGKVLLNARVSVQGPRLFGKGLHLPPDVHPRGVTASTTLSGVRIGGFTSVGNAEAKGVHRAVYARSGRRWRRHTCWVSWSPRAG
jgi:hypothetical protein